MGLNILTGSNLLFLFTVFFAFSCKSQNSLQVIHEKIGEEAVIIYNEGEEYALVKQNITSPQANFYSTNYLILQVKNNKILKEGRVTNGHIEWKDSNTIEIFEQPGAIRETDKKEDFKKYLYMDQLKQKKK
ncbi:MAG: hypothetical protein ACNS60_01800 [Candidatus Cyclobacteriaceae bacterium M2_1C_046]